MVRGCRIVDGMDALFQFLWTGGIPEVLCIDGVNKEGTTMMEVFLQGSKEGLEEGGSIVLVKVAGVGSFLPWIVVEEVWEGPIRY